jgi:NADH-quinone oxidoreductase subunit A
METPAAGAFMSPWEPGLLALGVYTFLVLALIGVMLFIAGHIGEKRESIEKSRPYECGIIPTGTARFHYPVPFYQVAMFFLIFDVEAAFIFAWGAAFDRLGWYGWLEISFFILVLLFSLIYIWRKGGLDWKEKTQGLPERSATWS